MRLSLGHDEEVSIQLMDVSGRMVQRIHAGWMAAGEHDLKLDLSAVGRGVYFLVAKSGYATQRTRLAVLR